MWGLCKEIGKKMVGKLLKVNETVHRTGALCQDMPCYFSSHIVRKNLSCCQIRRKISYPVLVYDRAQILRTKS